MPYVLDDANRERERERERESERARERNGEGGLRDTGGLTVAQTGLNINGADGHVVTRN